jgi:hypothetical protein
MNEIKINKYMSDTIISFSKEELIDNNFSFHAWAKRSCINVTRMSRIQVVAFSKVSYCNSIQSNVTDKVITSFSSIRLFKNCTPIIQKQDLIGTLRSAQNTTFLYRNVNSYISII